MKRYYENPEFKISIVGITMIVAVFFTLMYSLLEFQNYRLKDNYSKSMGALALRVIDKDPDMEKEIMPYIMKKATGEELDRGGTFLEKYGMEADVEASAFPYLNKITEQNQIEVFVISILLFIILCIAIYFQLGFFYDRIRRISIGAKKVIEGEYNISIPEEKEGDFSKLANSFNSMKNIIRSNITKLEDEKIFLVEILSDISHQLKTPLASLILYNDILLNKELNKEQQNIFLNNNSAQLFRMEWLIKNILKLAKLDARAVQFEMVKDELKETLEEAIENVESRAKVNKVNITLVAEKNIFLNHDRLWMEEAVSNIIKNSIEHSYNGNIDITLEENPIYTRITIADDGDGIEEEDLPNLFKRFYKTKNNKNPDSIGIGLAITKSIVEAHKGIIEVVSNIGQGTKFIITFLKY